MTEETTIIILAWDDDNQTLIHAPLTCSGVVTITGTEPHKHYICTAGHTSN